MLASALAILLLGRAPAFGALEPLDATHAAVLSALNAQKLADGCSPEDQRKAAAGTGIKRLGSAGGRDVILAAVQLSCVCGNVNCPFLVLRLDQRAPAVLYTTYAYAVTPFGARDPLPSLRAQSHDSALVSYETVAAYKNGAYADVSSVRVRSDNGERKPNGVPIRFKPGASSADLRGTVSLGWGDDYAFDAVRGQTVTIGGVVAAKPVRVMLSWANAAKTIELHPGVGVTLPQSGSYSLLVDGEGETPAAYSLRFAIR
ncbi:MAG TPA: hypothetical protein VKG44_11340 [Candidatus Baltobacteraceae bacterium]|nr:hypothetical protein [Candidatus Baltobacteraceae bacterium]